jgi:hypothetical protein
LASPLDGQPMLAFVTYGKVKLANLRRRPQLSATVVSGWQWATIEGNASIIGPDDPHPDIDAERLRQLLREIFSAAGGTHDNWAEYDTTMLEQRRAAVLVAPSRDLLQLAELMTRDRDEQGRPRNSRGRDELGRPLPRGVPGVPTTPDDLQLAPEASLSMAQQLLDDGRPFHAHEVLEASWKSAPAGERDLWQGLAQLAVAMTHELRGNHAGAATLAQRAADRLSGYADAAPYGIDVAGLTAWARSLAEGANSVAAPPRLRNSPPAP